ncbi:uncharacterized protein LOC143358329 [Halictus rubicundus]|uniref:uncharacterized protein LOC143358329 n=1 Tax=Halictus rubicundus TaxID=77578 RepID=UPI004036EEF0
MRRPGTLPNSGSSGHHRSVGPMEDGSSPLSIAADSCSSTGGRLHYSNHSLRRTPQPPHLPNRDAENTSERGQIDSRVQNGVPGGHQHQPPPPLPSRHQATCGQSSYPTLPMNGHAAHQYHHFSREKDRSSRDRSRDRDVAVQSVPHRSDKHRDAQMEMEMEMHDGMDMGEIGSYRA